MSWRRTVSVVEPHSPPLPLHQSKPNVRCHHSAVYGLSCDEYDRLLWQAGWRCQICSTPARDLYKGRLHIDHDSRRGNRWNHVRGLLCPKCNNGLRFVDSGFRSPTPEQQRYLDNAWFWTGLPPEQLKAVAA